MNTVKQLRTEFYDAITTGLVGLVSDRVYWINRVTVENTFPLITYQYFETSGEYTMGVTRVADDVIFQTDIYVDPQAINTMDDIVELMKTTLNAIGYRNINSPIEFFDTDTSKVIRPMRWERYNV